MSKFAKLLFLWVLFCGVYSFGETYEVEYKILFTGATNENDLDYEKTVFIWPKVDEYNTEKGDELVPYFFVEEEHPVSDEKKYVLCSISNSNIYDNNSNSYYEVMVEFRPEITFSNVLSQFQFSEESDITKIILTYKCGDDESITNNLHYNLYEPPGPSEANISYIKYGYIYDSKGTNEKRIDLDSFSKFSFDNVFPAEISVRRSGYSIKNNEINADITTFNNSTSNFDPYFEDIKTENGIINLRNTLLNSNIEKDLPNLFRSEMTFYISFTVEWIPNKYKINFDINYPDEDLSSLFIPDHFYEMNDALNGDNDYTFDLVDVFVEDNVKSHMFYPFLYSNNYGVRSEWMITKNKDDLEYLYNDLRLFFDLEYKLESWTADYFDSPTYYFDYQKESKNTLYANWYTEGGDVYTDNIKLNFESNIDINAFETKPNITQPLGAITIKHEFEKFFPQAAPPMYDNHVLAAPSDEGFLQYEDLRLYVPTVEYDNDDIYGGNLEGSVQPIDKFTFDFGIGNFDETGDFKNYILDKLELETIINKNIDDPTTGELIERSCENDEIEENIDEYTKSCLKTIYSSDDNPNLLNNIKFTIAPLREVVYSYTLKANYRPLIETAFTLDLNGEYTTAFGSEYHDQTIVAKENSTATLPKWIYDSDKCIVGWSFDKNAKNASYWGKTKSNELIENANDEHTLYAIWSKDMEECSTGDDLRKTADDVYITIGLQVYSDSLKDVCSVQLCDEKGINENNECIGNSFDYKYQKSYKDYSFYSMIIPKQNHPVAFLNANCSNNEEGSTYKFDYAYVHNTLDMTETEKPDKIESSDLPGNGSYASTIGLIQAYFVPADDSKPSNSTFAQSGNAQSGNSVLLNLYSQEESEVSVNLMDNLGNIIDEYNVTLKDSTRFALIDMSPGKYTIRITNGDSVLHSENITIDNHIESPGQNFWQMVSLANVELDSVKRKDGALFYWWNESSNYGDFWQYQEFNPKNKANENMGYWYSATREAPLVLRESTKEPKILIEYYNRETNTFEIENEPEYAEIEWKLESAYSGWNMVANPYGFTIMVPEELSENLWVFKTKNSHYEYSNCLLPYEAAWINADDYKRSQSHASKNGPQIVSFVAKPVFDISQCKTWEFDEEPNDPVEFDSEDKIIVEDCIETESNFKKFEEHRDNEDFRVAYCTYTIKTNKIEDSSEKCKYLNDANDTYEGFSEILKDANISLPKNCEESSRVKQYAYNQKSKKNSLLKASTQNGWIISPILKDNFGNIDSYNFVGKGFPEEKSEPPTNMGDYVSLYVVNGKHALAKSIVSEDSPMKWDIKLGSKTDRLGYLKFAGLSKIAKMGYHLYVTIDNKTEEIKLNDSLRVLLKSKGTYATITVQKEEIKTIATRIGDLKFAQENNQLHVTFNASENLKGSKVIAQLVSINGSVFNKKLSKAQNGFNSITFDKPKPGIYLVRINVGSKQMMQKVMVK